DLLAPDFGALVDVQGNDIRDFIAGAHGVEAVLDDGRPGKADPQLLVGPLQRRTVLWPALEQAGFLGNAGALGSAPLRPIRAPPQATGRQTDADNERSHSGPGRKD